MDSLPIENFIQKLPTGAYEIRLVVDHADRDAIVDAMTTRWEQIGGLPPSYHDDANQSGRLIGEICRGWMEMREAK